MSNLLIHKLFTYLVENKGSDLHISQGQPPKVRISGELVVIPGYPELTHETMLELLTSICEPHVYARFEAENDLDFAYEMNEESRFRCNYFVQAHGLGAIFRLIPTEILTLEDLSLPDAIERFTHLRSGLVLVTGPTGSGKSTTLAAIIDYINRHHRYHIVTIEEPIEFVHQNKQSLITQREVPVHAPNFTTALKAAIREDPNIILVGEMRDLETIGLALSAAEMGALVFGTLHTNSARKTIDRLIDAFPANQQDQVRTMLAGSLKGVVAQLLMKRIDKPGRVPVNEILVGGTAVSAIIREGATHKLGDAIVSGKAEGMQFMDDDIWAKMIEGKVSAEEAYMKSSDKARFAAFLPEELKQTVGKMGS